MSIFFLSQILPKSSYLTSCIVKTAAGFPFTRVVSSIMYKTVL